MTPLAKRKCDGINSYLQENLHIFRETFQKPGQIYRFLRITWQTNPLYLSRCLSYVSMHRARTSRKRNNSIDAIAEKLKHKLVRHDSKEPTRKSDKKCYFLRWICNDPSRTTQKTKSYGYICPWCDKDFGFLDSLMCHLKCCHPRFNWNLVEEDDQSVIEITLNSSFDGSYCGFKYPGHDMRHDFRFTPISPERRTPLTQIIHFRPKRISKPTKPNSGEFALGDDEVDVDVCSGRLYYHTSTCLPVSPKEVDSDSEAGMDPDWLRERTQLMIDEFTDVNEGEKEILKLWNLHIMTNYRYKSDQMIRQACEDFVDETGAQILSKNLTRNFILHLANLYDTGLLSSSDMLTCIQRLFGLCR